MTKSKSSTSRSSRRLQQKAAARNEADLNVVAEGEQTVAPSAEVGEAAAIDVTSPDDSSGIRVTITTTKENVVPPVGSTKGINIFHEHFAGIAQYPFMMLRIFATEELHQVQEVWTDETREKM